jgi:hypothetical protein
LLQNIPNGHKIYQHRPLQDSQKLTQSGWKYTMWQPCSYCVPFHPHKNSAKKS